MVILGIRPFYVSVFISNAMGQLGTDMGQTLGASHAFCFAVYCLHLGRLGSHPVATIFFCFGCVLLGASTVYIKANITERIQMALAEATACKYSSRGRKNLRQRSPSAPRTSRSSSQHEDFHQHIAHDQQYSSDTTDGLIDIYFHEQAEHSTVHSRPIAIWLHGGGWVTGDKRGAKTQPILQALYYKFGWVVVAVNFRRPGSTSKGGCTASLQDINRAMQWVKDHVSKYGGDSRNVALIAHSSGAHLASLYLAHEQLQHSGNKRYARPLTIRACIFISGMYDLEHWLAYHGDDSYFSDLAKHAILGRELPQTSITVEVASPCSLLRRACLAHASDEATEVSLALPPCLLVHGLSDPFCPSSQALELAALWRRVGSTRPGSTVSPCGVLIIPGCHGLFEIGWRVWARLPIFGAHYHVDQLVDGCSKFLLLHCEKRHRNAPR